MCQCIHFSRHAQNNAKENHQGGHDDRLAKNVQAPHLHPLAYQHLSVQYSFCGKNACALVDIDLPTI
jgi:hypothetical protein